MGPCQLGEKLLTLIVFIDGQGTRHEVDANDGLSVMEVAVNNGVPGLYGECGGTCSCATCHCYVSPEWASKLSPLSDLEDGMLDGSSERRSDSRLSCQIVVSPEIDGMELTVANNSI
jgi:2Fe-2S ferredoxin